MNSHALVEAAARLPEHLRSVQMQRGSARRGPRELSRSRGLRGTLVPGKNSAREHAPRAAETLALGKNAAQERAPRAAGTLPPVNIGRGNAPQFLRHELRERSPS